MDKQKENHSTNGSVEQSEDQIITRFGDTMIVITKDSIKFTIQSKESK